MIASAGAVVVGAYTCVLVTAAWTDLRTRRIPNRLTLPALAVALVVAGLSGTLTSAVGGALVGAALFILPMALYGLASAGGGDVKLAAFLGAALGFSDTVSALFLASLVAAAVVSVGLVTRRIRRRQKIPFGPFLAAGGLLVLLL